MSNYKTDTKKSTLSDKADEIAKVVVILFWGIGLWVLFSEPTKLLGAFAGAATY